MGCVMYSRKYSKEPLLDGISRIGGWKVLVDEVITRVIAALEMKEDEQVLLRNHVFRWYITVLIAPILRSK